MTMSGFIYLIHVSQLPAPILVLTISSSLVSAWGNFTDKMKKRKAQLHKKRKAKQTHGSTSEKEWSTPSSSRIKLLGFVITPCYHPSLLPVLRRSRKLLASSDLSFDSCFGVLHPDVCLKQNSGTLLVQACATIETGFRRNIFFLLR